MNDATDKQLRRKFKRMYYAEFMDANESFMDFMLDLISVEVLKEVIDKGKSYYYSLFSLYK